MKKIIGQRIKDLRESKNLEREDLAKMIGKTVSQVGHIERGDGWPPIPVLLQISQALGKDICYFFSEDPSLIGPDNIHRLQSELKEKSKELEKTKDTLIKLIQERLGFDKK